MDNDVSDPIELYRELVSFGPFDAPADVMQWSGWALERAVRVAQITEPHPWAKR